MCPDGSLNEGLACDGVKAEVAEALGGEDVARGNVARADDVLEGGGEGVPVCVHARGQQRGRGGRIFIPTSLSNLVAMHY